MFAYSKEFIFSGNGGIKPVSLFIGPINPFRIVVRVVRVFFYCPYEFTDTAGSFIIGCFIDERLCFADFTVVFVADLLPSFVLFNLFIAPLYDKGSTYILLGLHWKK